MTLADQQQGARQSSAWSVFAVFLRLGLTSFGGPVAHLGYFRAEFVERRKWLDEAGYGDIVALCQFLPGPASSQVGIALGLLRAGLPGGLAAWVGFTAPSALAMVLFAYGLGHLGKLGQAAWLHGLKIVAVAVVAQAVWGMARSLCPDRPRITLAVGAALLAMAVPSAGGQIAAIAIGGAIGWRLPGTGGGGPATLHLAVPLRRRTSIAALTLFFLLLVGLLLAALYSPVWTSAIHAPSDFAIALVAFLLLAFWKLPPWLVVILGALAAQVSG